MFIGALSDSDAVAQPTVSDDRILVGVHRAQLATQRIDVRIDCPLPVSYTHLDVYKRQPSNSVASALRMSRWASRPR